MEVLGGDGELIQLFFANDGQQTYLHGVRFITSHKVQEKVINCIESKCHYRKSAAGEMGFLPSKEKHTINSNYRL